DEPDLDLAGVVGFGFDLPLRADVPAEHDALGRFICEHSCPAAFAAVDGAVVDVASDSRLEHRRGDRCPEHVVLWRVEVPEPFGEHGKGALDRGVDYDLRADDRCRLLGHAVSSVACSTRSLYAANARFQNVSSWSRSASTPTGLSR